VVATAFPLCFQTKTLHMFHCNSHPCIST